MKINRVSKKNGYLEIIVPSGHITKIDLDEEWILKVFPSWRWSGSYIKICRYVKTEYGSAKEEYMLHRFILRSKEIAVFQIDHINRDKFDNRKSNLRWLSRADNCRNTAVRKYKIGASKHRGVRKIDRNKLAPWGAYITKEPGQKRRQIHLGYFKTEKEAAIAYNLASQKLYGECGWQNQI